MPLVGFPAYVDKCAEVAGNYYEGFGLTREHSLSLGANV
jgi:hypothetical protein